MVPQRLVFAPICRVLFPVITAVGCASASPPPETVIAPQPPANAPALTGAAPTPKEGAPDEGGATTPGEVASKPAMTAALPTSDRSRQVPPGPGGPPVGAKGDTDKDGIPDVADRCPDEPEDMDGFQDADGCVDIDNDGDGIVDQNDQCPSEPETKNGFQDDDGCPDKKK